MLDLLSAVLAVAGAGFFVAGTVGLLRFPDLLSRLHAVTKADNLGLGLVLAAVALQSGSAAVAAKLGIIWALALLASATISHLLARPESEATS
jgi:multicomponent Na+:H+ antiporter subunit G